MVSYAICSLARDKVGSSILLKMENISMVQYVDKLRGTRSKALGEIVKESQQFCPKRTCQRCIYRASPTPLKIRTLRFQQLVTKSSSIYSSVPEMGHHTTPHRLLVNGQIQMTEFHKQLLHLWIRHRQQAPKKIQICLVSFEQLVRGEIYGSHGGRHCL